jgi:hypothetical protein
MASLPCRLPFPSWQQHCWRELRRSPQITGRYTRDCYRHNGHRNLRTTRRTGLPTPITYWFGGWLPEHGVALGIGFTLDFIGAGLAMFSPLLMTGTLVYS